MSKHQLRDDKTCQNCGYLVEARYCSKCGQENTETRQTFGHLIRHFLEDITHYDGAFWRTMKYLLFRPAYLTKQYLYGKRNSFLPPVRLYIFISFITFFIPYILPEFSSDFDNPLPKEIEKKKENPNVHFGIGIRSGRVFYANSPFKSFTQYDSIQQTLAINDRDNWLDRWTTKKEIELSKHEPDELEEKFIDSFSHNFPKALFVFMPLFALIVRLFHNKKKWLYFDCAIFTLHYFSFLLLVFTFLNIINTIVPTPWLFSNESSAKTFVTITALITVSWFFAYLFRAHRKMFEEKWLVSFTKSFFILVINFSVFLMLIFGLGIITVMNLH